MAQIAAGSMLALERYVRERNAFRSRVIAHKKLRTAHMGDHVTLIFEDGSWVEVEGCTHVYAIADEDMERENEEKTSAVHFVRFELDEQMRRELKQGAGLAIGVDHPNYRAGVSVAPEVRQSLAGDLA